MPTYRVAANTYAVVATWGQHTDGAANSAGTSYGAQVAWLPDTPIISAGPQLFLPTPEPASSVDLASTGLVLAAQPLVPVPGMVTVFLIPAVLVVTGVAVDPDPGPVTVALTPAVLGLTSVAVDPEVSPATVDLTPTVLTFAGVALDPDPGMVTVGLTSAGLGLSSVGLDPEPGPTSVSLTPAGLSLTPTGLDPDPGMVTTALTPAVLNLNSVPLDPQGTGGGSASTLLTPAGLTLTPTTLGPAPGPVTIDLTSTILNLAARPLLFEGSLVLTVTIDLTIPGFPNIVEAVGACIVDALDQTPAGSPTRQCLLLPTAIIPWDDCDCGGQVALAIRRIYGSQIFPQETANPTDWHHCGPRLWVADVLVSVTRCITGVDEVGNPPLCDTALAEAIILENDRTAVRQAIACCLQQMRETRPPALGVQSWILGGSATVGEQGACAGVETSFLVGVAACACPPDG